MIRHLFGLLCLAIAAVPCAADARTWYVAPAGSDANAGRTAAAPFATLQRAAEAVAPGDTVLLAGGVYASPKDADAGSGSALLKITRSGRPDAWITWRAMPGQRPELRSRLWSAIEIAASYQIIDGLTVTGQNDEIVLSKAIEAAKQPAKQAFYNTNGIFINGRNAPPEAKPHHVIVRNCTVSKMPGGGITAIEADYVTIEDNRVFDNAWYMEYGGSGITTLNNWAFDHAPGYHVIVRRNLVWNNKTFVPWSKIGKLSDGNGILFDVTDPPTAAGATNPNADAVLPGAAAVTTPQPVPAGPVRPLWDNRSLIANNVSAFNGGSGIHVFRTAHVDIVNNTTYWNGSNVGYEELFPNRSSDIVILNNVIVPRPGGQVTSNNRNTAVRWDYNIYPQEQAVLRGPHDIVADPGLVDPYRDLMRANFRVAPASRAVGTGTAELRQATDLAGRPRAAGKPVDRGAYQR